MNCQNFQDIIQSYRAGKSPGVDLSPVREHLRNCSGCRSGLTAEDLVEILPIIDTGIEPSGDFSSRFYAKLEARKAGYTEENRVQTSKRKTSWLSGWQMRVAAACIMIALVTAGIYFRGSSPTVDTSAVFYELEVTENLTLLQDMGLLEDLEFFQDLDAIESMPFTN